MERKKITMHHPRQKNRFRIEFFRGQTCIGKQELLSGNLVDFEFDDIVNEFICSFQLPSEYEKDLYNEIRLIQEFYLHVLDGNGNSVFEKKFEFIQLTKLTTQFDYSSSEAVTVVMKGIYKQ